MKLESWIQERVLQRADGAAKRSLPFKGEHMKEVTFYYSSHILQKSVFFRVSATLTSCFVNHCQFCFVAVVVGALSPWTVCYNRLRTCLASKETAVLVVCTSEISWSQWQKCVFIFDSTVLAVYYVYYRKKLQIFYSVSRLLTQFFSTACISNCIHYVT
jgi:hypothetical protein